MFEYSFWSRNIFTAIKIAHCNVECQDNLLFFRRQREPGSCQSSGEKGAGKVSRVHANWAQADWRGKEEGGGGRLGLHPPRAP